MQMLILMLMFMLILMQVLMQTDADVDAHVTQVRAIRKKIFKSHERLYRIVPGQKSPRPILSTTFFSCVVPTRTSAMADITHPILDCSNCVVQN